MGGGGGGGGGGAEGIPAKNKLENLIRLVLQGPQK